MSLETNRTPQTILPKPTYPPIVQASILPRGEFPAVVSDQGKTQTRKKTYIKKTKCDICKISFKRGSTLRLHLLTHKYKTFSCETCHAEFPTLGCLQKHCLVEHEKRRATIKSVLKPPKGKRQPEEVTKKDKDDSIEQESAAPAQSKKEKDKVAKLRDRCLRFVNDKVFSCKHCGKFLSTENRHKEHELSHDFTKPLHKRRPGYIKRIDTLDAGSVQKQHKATN